MKNKKHIISIYCMAALYIIAGSIHLIHPSFYIRLIPSFIPYPFVCVIGSGIVEIILGVLLFFPGYRIVSAWMIITMLIVYTVLIHVPMVIDYYEKNHAHLWIAVLRLPLQALLIWWTIIVIKGDKKP